MMKSIHSSELAAVLALVLGLSLAVPVAAVSTTAVTVPDEGEVGTEVEASYRISDLYEGNDPDEWTLRATTELEGVSWTVQKRKLSGDVEPESHSGSTFETTISSDDGDDVVTVSVVGTVPPLAEPQYDPAETFSITRLDQVTGAQENKLGEWNVHHYTASSREAREEIEDAQAVVDADAPEDAQRELEQAISAYNAGNFENAIANAEDAQRTVDQADRSQSRMQAALYAGLGVLALLVVFGGVYYYQRRRDTYKELR